MVNPSLRECKAKRSTSGCLHRPSRRPLHHASSVGAHLTE